MSIPPGRMNLEVERKYKLYGRLNLHSKGMIRRGDNYNVEVDDDDDNVEDDDG